jgi:hypothetical protein
MSTTLRSLLFSAGALILSVGYHAIAPIEYPRVGLLAGLAVGMIYGISLPVEDQTTDRLRRAVRSALAFGITTGVGYSFYHGTTIGLSWGGGGTLGCVAGCLTGQFGRILFVTEDPGD